MVEVGRRLCLTAEAFDEGLIAGVLGEEHLDRHRTVEQEIACEVHVGHAAAGELAMELVSIIEDCGGGRRVTHRPQHY